MKKIIFFGNGPLAEYALRVIEKDCKVIFHARTREDLEKVKKLKIENPEAYGVLASFGVLIKSDILELFEPEGILNIHPSLLPLYRGASPIESAILAGDEDFGISVMKLVPEMDTGPIYIQATLSDCSLDKDFLYKSLAETGAKMVLAVLGRKKYKEPTPQDDSRATFCGKMTKSMGVLTPETDTAEVTLRKIIAFQGFPKAKYAFFGQNCIILGAHVCEPGETAVLALPCADGQILSIDRLQPEGKRPMDAKSFLNGYAK